MTSCRISFIFRSLFFPCLIVFFPPVSFYLSILLFITFFFRGHFPSRFFLLALLRCATSDCLSERAVESLSFFLAPRFEIEMSRVARPRAPLARGPLGATVRQPRRDTSVPSSSVCDRRGASRGRRLGRRLGHRQRGQRCAYRGNEYLRWRLGGAGSRHGPGDPGSPLGPAGTAFCCLGGPARVGQIAIRRRHSCKDANFLMGWSLNKGKIKLMLPPSFLVLLA